MESSTSFNFDFISDSKEEFIDIAEYLDFDAALEDIPEGEELNSSCDTTLSAIEGMDLDLDDIDVDQVLEQLERNISQVWNNDELLLTTVEELQPEEFVEVQPQSHDCATCGLHFTTASNLKRHFRSIKHQQNAAKTPAADSQLIQTGPLEFEVKVLTLDQLAGLELNFDDFAMAEEEAQFEAVESAGRKRKNRSRLSQKCVGRDGKKLFRCAHCPKVFTTASNLSRHENLHGMQKLHECTECGKKFQQKEYLKKHQVVHERTTVRKGKKL